VATILIVDDEKNIRATIARGLRLEGFRTVEAGNGEEALAILEDQDADAVLLDVEMPRLDGLATLEAMRDRGLSVPAIVLTAHGSIERAVRAVKLGAFDFIEKPPSMERILIAIGHALDRGRLLSENRRLADESGATAGLLGDSEPMRALRAVLSRVAPTEATILLLGENGTGKELAARAIHDGSPRKARPFVTVNCAAIPETLFESELFGHLRGAFTGATDARRGKFSQADGGTLFLDEVGEIPLHLQPKLLRVLESQEVERLGGGAPEKVDVRLVAATNRDLPAEVETGRFRRDLYHRLDVVPVRVPPLRERRTDIPSLAAHFLDLACRRNRVRPKTLADDAKAALSAHRWPGNVRELRNVMERIAILVQEAEVGAVLLEGLAGAAATPSEIEETGGTLAARVDAFERKTVLEALERNRWRMTRTAEQLGLERSHLYKKLKALGIERPVEE